MTKADSSQWYTVTGGEAMAINFLNTGNMSFKNIKIYGGVCWFFTVRVKEQVRKQVAQGGCVVSILFNA